jgi:hypothetical protein
MFNYAIFVFTFLIGFLPANSIDWTGSNRIIYIMVLIRGKFVHAREAIVIELKYFTRDSNTSTATYTS